MIRRDQIHLSLASLYTRRSLLARRSLATNPNSILPGPAKNLCVYLSGSPLFYPAPGSSPR